MACDNSNSRGRAILNPGCFGNTVEKKLTVIYNEVEKTTLELCGSCARSVQSDAERHGYRVKLSEVRA